MVQLREKSERDDRRQLILDIPAGEYDPILAEVLNSRLTVKASASVWLKEFLKLLSRHLEELEISDWQVYVDGLVEGDTVRDEIVSLAPNASVVEFLSDDEVDDDDDLIDDDDVDPRELLRAALADVRAGRVYTEEEFWKALEEDDDTEQPDSGGV